MAIEKKILLIGYSGHGYVVYDIFTRMGRNVSGFFDKSADKANPFNLQSLGPDNPENLQLKIQGYDYFISIGENSIRKNIFESLSGKIHLPINAIDPSSVLSKQSKLGSGVMIGSNAVINSLTEIGDGVICNTGVIVEHECKIGNFAHLAPGCILTGNVEVGEASFIGAGAVIKQGIKIGRNVIVGAGTIVLQDLPDGSRVVGNPQRFLKN